MVSVMSLWLPIVVSAVLVFVVSSIIHMVLRYHRGDWRAMPNEDGVMEAVRRFGIPPGDYLVQARVGVAGQTTGTARATLRKQRRE